LIVRRYEVVAIVDTKGETRGGSCEGSFKSNKNGVDGCYISDEDDAIDPLLLAIGNCREVGLVVRRQRLIVLLLVKTIMPS